MNPKLFSRMAVVLAVTLGVCGRAQGQDISCNDAKVEYSTPKQEFEQRITLSAATSSAPANSKQDSSPQGTRWIITVGPDYTKNAPWNTTLLIGDRSTGKTFLKAEFREHSNGFSAKWINEKLIFIEVWWGRIASSDLILDVENKKFIYDQFAHYGQVTFCKEP